MNIKITLRHANIAALGGGWVLLSSCASVTSGTTQDISITSEPSGARVLLEDKPVGVTPTELELSRKTSHRVNIQHPGDRDYEVIIEPAANNMSAGNIIVGGIVGAAIDHSSGASNRLVPESVHAVLKKR